MVFNWLETLIRRGIWIKGCVLLSDLIRFWAVTHTFSMVGASKSNYGYQSVPLVTYRFEFSFIRFWNRFSILSLLLLKWFEYFAMFSLQIRRRFWNWRKHSPDESNFSYEPQPEWCRWRRQEEPQQENRMLRKLLQTAWTPAKNCPYR